MRIYTVYNVHTLRCFYKIFLLKIARKNCAKNNITPIVWRERGRDWRKRRRKEQVSKSKSLIKTDLFATKLCITWLLLLCSVGFLSSSSKLARFSFAIFLFLSLFGSLIVTWLTTYVHMQYTNEFLPNVFFDIVCCIRSLLFSFFLARVSPFFPDKSRKSIQYV